MHLNVNISSMKSLIELFEVLFSRLPDIHGKWYLPQTQNSNLQYESESTLIYNNSKSEKWPGGDTSVMPEAIFPAGLTSTILFLLSVKKHKAST